MVRQNSVEFVAYKVKLWKKALRRFCQPERWTSGTKYATGGVDEYWVGQYGGALSGYNL